MVYKFDTSKGIFLCKAKIRGKAKELVNTLIGFGDVSIEDKRLKSFDDLLDATLHVSKDNIVEGVVFGTGPYYVYDFLSIE